MNDLAIIIALTGRIEDSINEIGTVIESFSDVDGIQLVFAYDDKKWESIPIMQLLEMKVDDAKKIITSKHETLAGLYNNVLKEIEAEFVSFWQIDTDNISDRIKIYCDYSKTDELENINFIQREINKTVIPSDMNRYGLLQTGIYYSVDDFIIRRSYLLKNSFNETKLLRNDFFREWVLRNSRIENFSCIGHLGAPRKKYNKKTAKIASKDLIERYIIRCGANNGNIEQINENFVNDLKDYEAEEVAKYLDCKNQNKPGTKYKIMILGGYWEYHHNQIVFMNYFERVAGKRFATFNVKLDSECLPTDLIGYDLVIFTRTRSENAIKLVEYCNKHEITSLYMLDDNWFSIANDFPEYGDIFTEGKPEYDNFIEIVKKCDGVWYFNDFIKQDLEKYASRFIQSRISVDNSLFVSERKQIDKKGKYIIGYSGSLRYDDTAFKALAKVAKENDNVIVALVGNMSEKQLEYFKGVEIITVPFSSYSIYAKRISEIKPDLLVAPLDSSRTSQSKCYNKYVESGVIGAACIFSNVKPYTDVVKDNYNGFLLDQNTEEAWFNKINEIIADSDLLDRVKNNAYEDVMKNHTVDAVLPIVLHNIEVVINEWK
ncbi:glycosyltransferase [Butyrivibrio sp. VCD2006]|uniref:glycosyltransferase n=1 Tax=Butyrivibrio sp. VCD2006 TaxID=1280664 RepID=UPI0003F643A8|nr:glycosyltransferase [Butyrivibrio sp. VCD2006]